MFRQAPALAEWMWFKFGTTLGFSLVRPGLTFAGWADAAFTAGEWVTGGLTVVGGVLFLSEPAGDPHEMFLLEQYNARKRSPAWPYGNYTGSFGTDGGYRYFGDPMPSPDQSLNPTPNPSPTPPPNPPPNPTPTPDPNPTPAPDPGSGSYTVYCPGGGCTDNP